MGYNHKIYPIKSNLNELYEKIKMIALIETNL